MENKLQKKAILKSAVKGKMDKYIKKGVQEGRKVNKNGEFINPPTSAQVADFNKNFTTYTPGKESPIIGRAPVPTKPGFPMKPSSPIKGRLPVSKNREGLRATPQEALKNGLKTLRQSANKPVPSTPLVKRTNAIATSPDGRPVAGVSATTISNPKVRRIPAGVTRIKSNQ